jgi:hypothetical protein
MRVLLIVIADFNHLASKVGMKKAFVDLHQRCTPPAACRIDENQGETKLPFKDLCFRIPNKIPTKDASLEAESLTNQKFLCCNASSRNF